MNEPNGTKVSLKEYFDAALKNQEAKVDMIIKGQELALTLAKSEVDRRLEDMNNFREDMRKMQGQFLTREEYEGKHALIQQQVDDLRIIAAKIEGKASSWAVIGAYTISIIGIIIALLHLFK